MAEYKGGGFSNRQEIYGKQTNMFIQNAVLIDFLPLS